MVLLGPKPHPKQNETFPSRPLRRAQGLTFRQPNQSGVDSHVKTKAHSSFCCSSV